MWSDDGNAKRASPRPSGESRKDDARSGPMRSPAVSTSKSPLDLDAYFLRIGYTGPRAPTLGTLHAIACAHVTTIPFENLDVLLGRGVSLEDADVDRKLLAERRGGYCFEHNSLLLRVLVALGYEARPLSARVRLSRPRDFTPARSHMFVGVELDGTSWLVDVGVGGMSPTAALRLQLDVEQPTPHEPRRFVLLDGRWLHQAKVAGEWIDVCEFTREEMPAIDRVVANWYTSTHPNSHFRDRLMVALARADGGRITLLNRDLTVRTPDGTATTRALASPAELIEVLRGEFGLSFPPGTTFDCTGLRWP